MNPALSGLGAERLVDSGERVVITGAAGWLGMATLEMLRDLLGNGFFRRVVCFGASERTLRLRKGVQVTQQRMELLSSLRSEPSIVLHLAFATWERFNTMPPEAYAAVNRATSDQIKALLGSIGARALYLGSSGAVYLTDDPVADESKRKYGALKRLDEARFARWASEASSRVVIGRVFNISGPYINKWSSYALSSFIADVQSGRPIAITATKKVYRSYVALEELMSVVFGALTDPNGGVIAFDTVGGEVVELDELARDVQTALGREVGISRPAVTDDDADRYVGDAAIYRRLLAKYGVRHTPLVEQICQTAEYMAAWPDPFDAAGEHL